MRAGEERPTTAILAGSGRLPLLLADHLEASGTRPRILAFRGFASRALARRADAVIGLLDIRSAIACLAGWRPERVTLAGGLARPSAAAALDAFSALRSREEVTALLGRGDDNLLRGVVGLLEERGYRLVGVRDLAPDLLAPAGPHGRLAPDAAARAAIQRGIAGLAALTPFDIGQAVVLRGERVLAVEGPEGTDATLRRVAGAPIASWLRRRDRDGVLVKAPKRGQDLRVDLPAVGPRTVVEADRAGLAGIAVASGLTLVLDREETIAEADRRGLFLAGIQVGPDGA
ncbi:MAG: UDP-2,3-diacylglucosamine diphosphatase LpxI [Methylobacteriaceae bacterium]|nr:UDP-2,3-diacylglucosamine diphosphatase LpxI [Methylobacteriaceae bacterium]